MWARAWEDFDLFISTKSPVCSLGTTITSGKIDKFTREPFAAGLGMCWQSMLLDDESGCDF